MIHLLHKYNYITTLISDGHRPMPRDASFPNIAEKKVPHAPEQKCNQNERSSSTIFSHASEKTGRHPGTWGLALQRASSPCLLELVTGGIYTLGHASALSKDLWKAGPEVPLSFPPLVVSHTLEFYQKILEWWAPNTSTTHEIPQENQEKQNSTGYQCMKPTFIKHLLLILHSWVDCSHHSFPSKQTNI